MSKCFGYVTNKGKAIRQSIMEEYAVKDAEVSSRALSDEFQSSYGEMGLVTPIYNPRSLANLMEINTYHARSISTIARDTAGIGWVLTPEVENPSNDESSLLRDFIENQQVPIGETLYRAELDYRSVGFSAIELVREGMIYTGKPYQLHHIPSLTLRRHKDGKRVVQTIGTKKRWFKMVGVEQDLNCETGELLPSGSLDPSKRASEIVWNASYSPRSELYGVPEWISILGTIAGDFSRREYNRTFFDNYGVPAYAVFVTGNFDPGEEDEKGRTELERAIEKHFDEIARNPHSTLILTLPTMGNDGDVKIEFKPLATEIKEASFRMYRADNRDEIITAHGIPPYRIGVMVSGQLAGNMAQEATQIYKMSVLEPRQNNIEQWINHVIVRQGFGITDWTWELEEIDLTDEKHEIELHKSLFDIGAITVAEIRSRWADRMNIDHEMPEAEGAPRFAVIGAPALVQGGIMTLNEARAQMGLEPVPGGDELRDPDMDAVNVVERSLKDLRSQLNAAYKQ